MNLVMNGDGAGNIFSFNSLAFPLEQEDGHDVKPAMERIPLGSVHAVFTNPPFGTKIPVDDQRILQQFELARQWIGGKGEPWTVTERIQRSVPPEILFIERCVKWTIPDAGRVAIVLPTGILANRNTTYVRQWILQNCEVFASIQSSKGGVSSPSRGESKSAVSQKVLRERTG